jgi:(p)ppGpp synthase/HD superfamily hydrolase
LRQKNVEELYDIFAIRIILNTNNPLLCFYVYGIVANYYKPMPETFKDYISNPKENGYSSLHVAVAGPDNKIVEVQIRTAQMHKVSEVGVAAHFKYKSGVQGSVLEDNNIQHWLDEIRDIFEKIGNENSSKLFGIISNNMLQDKIYVFTSKDEFRQLPKGATALDFAFEIHTEIGFSCIGAKVNGRLCAINYVLNSGDKVEIITSKKQKPTQHWLDFVVTHHASSSLAKYLKDENNRIIARGKEIWENKNKEIGFKLREEDMFYLFKVYNFDDENDFYKAIGNNSIDIDSTYQLVMLKISDKILNDVKNFDNENDDDANIVQPVSSLQPRRLENISSYKFEFLDCCEPLPGDSIFGIMETQDMISVHSTNCLKYRKLLRTHPNDLIVLDWDNFDNKIFNAKLHIIAEDSENLLQEIITRIVESSREHNKMTSISYDTVNSIFDGILGFNVNTDSPITAIISSIERIENIQTIERISTKK